MDLADIQSATSAGQSPITNATKILVKLYGRPQSEARTPDGVTLKWSLQPSAERSKPLVRVITINLNGRPTTSCSVTAEAPPP